MTAFKLIYEQAFRLLCLVALMAVTFSIFAQDAQKPWSTLVAERKADIQQGLLPRGDKVITIGDSHAAFLAQTASACPTTVVNAGVNGATSKRYLELLDTLRVSEKARKAIVSIGTNDIFRKRGTTTAEFRANAEKIVRSVSRISERVTVSAIPPIALASSDLFDDEKAFEFSEVLRDVCERHANCAFADPHRAHRNAERPGTGADDYLSADGVHLANYAALSEQLEICPSTAPSAKWN